MHLNLLILKLKDENIAVSTSSAPSVVLTTQKIYGVPLTKVQDRVNNVPAIILHFIKYLEENGGLDTEGIFRLCATQDKLDVCTQQIDEGYFLFYLLLL